MSQLRSSPRLRVKRGRSPEPFQAASQDLQKKARIDANAEIDLEEVKALLVTQGQILKSAELEFADQSDFIASNQTQMQELLKKLCGLCFLARKDLDPTGVGRVTRVQAVTGAER